MRNIADIVKDDRNGKQLSQTERQVAVAYVQGKYDAVRELKTVNSSNINEVLGKIRAEIKQLPTSVCSEIYRMSISSVDFKEDVLAIIDKYREESEKENEIQR